MEKRLVTKRQAANTFGDYILDLHINHLDSSKLWVSLSDFAIKLYDTQYGKYITDLNKILIHSQRVTGIESSKITADILYSASEDKTFAINDIRISKCNNTTKLTLSSEILCMAVGANDYLLTLGIDSNIHFYDLRMTSEMNSPWKKLAEYNDVHSDIVTQLKFHPNHSHYLASASEDGLICIFDLSTNPTESTIISILNCEKPINKFGFFGQNNEGIYSLSTIETLSCQHYPSAQKLNDFKDIKEKMSVDFLVDCVYHNRSDELELIAGMYDGMGKSISISPDGCDLIGLLHSPDSHQSTIRAVESVENNQYSSFCYYTGSEDGSICIWTNEERNEEDHLATVRNEVSHHNNQDFHLEPESIENDQPLIIHNSDNTIANIENIHRQSLDNHKCKRKGKRSKLYQWK